MAKKKTIQPKLRFKNEEGKDYPDWEEKKLGEIGEIVSGLTYSPDDVVDEDVDGILVLRSSNVNGRRLAFENNVFVKAEKYNPVKENDILICVRNGSKNLIGKNAIIKRENEGLAFGAFMTVYRSPYNRFLFHWFDTEEYKKKVSANLGATINSINGSDLKKFRVPFPSLEEQKKIGEFLSAIDDKIENLEKELEELKAYKKGVMQAIFAAASDATERRSDGATERRLKIEALQGTKKHGLFIRFKDENGKDYPEWIEVKIGEVMTLRKSKHDGNKSTTNFKCVELEHLDQGTGKILGYTNSSEQKSIKNVFKRNDVLFGKLRPYLRKFWKAEFDGVCSSEVWVLVPKTKQIVEDYIFYFIQSDVFIDATNISSGTKMPRADWTLVSETKMFMPSVIEEQQKIGSYLSAVDKKISHLAEQLTGTRQYKQALLQQLFN